MLRKIQSFFNQVNSEVHKISWASRKETNTSVLVVVVMIIIASGFFVTVDYAAFSLVNWLLEFRM
jgi:preprotein translocase subunit SecE